DNEPHSGTGNLHHVQITEDAKGRVTRRDYYPGSGQGGPHNSYFKYDQQDRVLCETTDNVACPTSASATDIKNDFTSTPPFTHAGDWKTLIRPINGTTGQTNAFAITTGTHQTSDVNQSDGSPIVGHTYFYYDARGN